MTEDSLLGPDYTSEEILFSYDAQPMLLTSIDPTGQLILATLGLETETSFVYLTTAIEREDGVLTGDKDLLDAYLHSLTGYVTYVTINYENGGKTHQEERVRPWEVHPDHLPEPGARLR